MAATKSTSIAIIGAGPAGLTLARLLLVSPLCSTSTTGPKVCLTIFEKDDSAHSRVRQGGSLDLHPETGLSAMKNMELWDEFVKYARYEGEEMVVADKHGTQILHLQDQTSSNLDPRPEVGREQLKDILLASVAEKGGKGTIKWGKQLASIDQQGILHFKDNTTEGAFDLVVGADGAFSKVRPVLTSVHPHYSGVCGFEIHIREPTTKHPEISKHVGRGIFFSCSDGKTLIAQRQSDDSIKVSAYLLQNEKYASSVFEAAQSQHELKKTILARYKDWSPLLTRWVESGEVVKPWNLYELPVGHTFEHKQGYTLISDAAHLMTPFAGKGVNAGMKDALELSTTIVAALAPSDSSQSSLNFDEAILKFEQEMFIRGRAVQAETMRNKTNMFSRSAPVSYMVGFSDELVKMVLKKNPETDWVARIMA